MFRPEFFASVLALLFASSAFAAASCIDESAAEPQEGYQAPVPTEQPRAQLQELVRDAVNRSNAVGAAKLLAEAAVSDEDEARAESKPQVTANISGGPSGTVLSGLNEGSGFQVRGGVNVAAPLYDGGRINRLTDWRAQLAEAARQGQITTQEQVAFQAVSLALERSRYRLQVQVYQQYARKMNCLVEALQQIVQADRGRASELVQARKTLQQAQIAYTQAQSSVRQTEIRLRRFVGDGLPTGEGLSSVLTQVPPLNEIMAGADRASEIAALGAQANAADSYAKSVVAGQKPQVGWSLTGSKALGVGNPSSWSAGINVSVPLYNATFDPQAEAARKRAEAARLQRTDALESRKSRVSDVYEQALSSFDHAHRVVAVLRDSEKVREYTLQQWQQLGKRSLFDVMAAEGDHYGLRIAYVNALFDGEQANALLWSLGGGIYNWLQ